MVNCPTAQQMKEIPKTVALNEELHFSHGSSFQYQQLKLSEKLHTTLELDELVVLYFGELAKQYDIDGLEYQSAADKICIELGKKTNYSHSQKLFADEDKLGNLIIFCRRQLDEADILRIRQLTHTFSFSLRNALAYRRVKLTSQTDFLTGAGNRAAMEASLDREFELAHRHQHSLSLLMLDLDHFKTINDEHGHPFGDKVLQVLVRELKQGARISDTVYRYGGEEFSVILNCTNTYGAMVIAERIRETIEQLQIYSDSGEKVPITVSVGVATLLSQDTAQDLVQRADNHLYLAKQKGRNQVWGEFNQGSRQPAANSVAGFC